MNSVGDVGSLRNNTKPRVLSSKALKKIGINAIFLQQIGIPLLMDEMDNILPSWVL